MKHDKCTVPSCPNYGRYCRIHPSAESAKPKAIKVVSKKRSAINAKQYGPAAAKYRAEHPLCSIRSPDCTRLTQGVHHLKGKDSIELLLDQRYWVAACNACNRYVEKNDAWARANGFKLSKHSKQ